MKKTVTLIQVGKIWPKIYMGEYSKIAKKIVWKNHSEEQLATKYQNRAINQQHID